MRNWTLLPLVLLAACSGGGEAPKDVAEEAPASMPAGQWSVASEVTSFRSTDGTTPALKAAAGDKAEAQGCVVASEPPPPSLFAGEDYDCTSKTSYVRNGRLNLSLECRREGITGAIPMIVEGRYTATGFEATVNTQTYLPGSGDFAMTRKLTGRRTAEACAPAPEEPEEKGKGKAG